jgi:hypothetical protein
MIVKSDEKSDVVNAIFPKIYHITFAMISNDLFCTLSLNFLMLMSDNI